MIIVLYLKIKKKLKLTPNNIELRNLNYRDFTFLVHLNIILSLNYK